MAVNKVTVTKIYKRSIQKTTTKNEEEAYNLSKNQIIRIISKPKFKYTHAHTVADIQKPSHVVSPKGY